MAMPGMSSGMSRRRVLMASVPPVEAPRTMIFSVLTIVSEADDFSRMASAVYFG